MADCVILAVMWLVAGCFMLIDTVLVSGCAILVDKIIHFTLVDTWLWRC